MDGKVLSAVLAADLASARLLNGRSFETVVYRLLEHALAKDVKLLAGASPTGQMLAGAMLLAGQGRLCAWSVGASGAVLVVDGYVAGFAGLDAVMGTISKLSPGNVFGLALTDRATELPHRGDVDLLHAPLTNSPTVAA